MRDGKLSVDRVKIVPIWIDLFIVNCHQNITLLEPSLGGRPTTIDLVDVNAAIGILKL
jgi:hypothetical protein